MIFFLLFIGLLDQWMTEGKFTEEEALSQSYDMLSAGIDTVIVKQIKIKKNKN